MKAIAISIALGMSVAALNSCTDPGTHSDNATVVYGGRREFVGPRWAAFTSPVLFSKSKQLVWKCNVSKIPVSNGYSDSYMFNIRFFRRIGKDIVPFIIPEARSPEIHISYDIRDSSQKTCVLHSSTLDDWKASGSEYWPNYVEKPRMQKARELGNIFFHAEGGADYVIEVRLNLPADYRNLGAQVVLRS